MRQQPGNKVFMTGVGSYLPGEPIPFDDADRILGEFDQVDDDFKRWYKRTRRTMKQLLGIEHYYYALDPITRQPTETPSSLAARAGEKALEAAGLKPDDIDIVFYAGATQDCFVTPPTSVFVQQSLGIKRCAEMSIHSNCTSTYKAIQIAADQIAYGRYDTALVTTANMVSVGNLASSFNQSHLTRHQAMLRWFLCDGGGAVVLRRGDDQTKGLEVFDTFTESVGLSHEPHMYSRFGSASNPMEAIAQGLHHINQDFQKVSSLGPEFFVDCIFRFGEQLGIDPTDERVIDQIPYILLNVPSDHLMDVAFDSTARRTKLPYHKLKERYYSTVANRGYTGPAAVLVTLDELLRKEKLKDGDFILSLVVESSKWMNAGFMLRYQK